MLIKAMMREYGLTQSQYEAIRDALIAQNVISATAGQAYAGAWQDLLYGDLAEYGVGYAPVLGNIYFAKKRKEAAASQAGAASGGVAAGGALPPDRGPGDEDNNQTKRIYEPSPKHDPQGGWGSENPIPNHEIGQELLDSAYSSSKNKQLYNIYKGYIIKFQPDGVSGKWHAYKVSNTATEVPTDVYKQMLKDGLISKSDYIKLIKNNWYR